MNTIVLEGVEYTKASQIAKQFGYTSDYIGQLCRAKKVDARLVGRTWFVSVNSLQTHRENKYQTQTPDSRKVDIVTSDAESESSDPITVKSDLPSKKYLRRVPPPEAKIRKIIQREEDGKIRNFSLQYETDDHSLIPKLANHPKVTLLRVGIADSESISVKSHDKRSSTLKPEKLPDVALSGSLAVSDIPDDREAPSEVESVPDAKSAERDNHSNKIKIKKIETEQAVPEVDKLTLDSEKKLTQSHQTKDKIAYKLESKQEIKPQTVKTTQIDIPVTDIPTKEFNIPIQFHVTAAVVLAVVISTLLISAEQIGFVTGESSSFAIKFTWSNITNLASVLFTL